jgi:hypothetical protein
MPWNNQPQRTYAERKAARQMCEDAAAAVLARGPIVPPADELARVQWFLETAAWRFARSMPQNPHWYTLRKTWENDDDFVTVVLFIRKYGYVERFPDPVKGWPYITMDIAGFHYWSMGCPIGDKDTYTYWDTILINRKPLPDAYPFTG